MKIYCSSLAKSFASVLFPQAEKPSMAMVSFFEVKTKKFEVKSRQFLSDEHLKTGQDTLYKAPYETKKNQCEKLNTKKQIKKKNAESFFLLKRLIQRFC